MKTDDMVAKMLGKKEFKPVESKHINLDAGKVVNINVGKFKGGLDDMKTDLKSKLPKPKKLDKINLGKKCN